MKKNDTRKKKNYVLKEELSVELIENRF